MSTSSIQTKSQAWEGWILAACALSSLVFLWPWERPLPAGCAGVLVFGLVQVLFPHCRPVRKAPLCPWNWALLVFGFKLVVLPLAEVVGGVKVGELPRLPSDASINFALLLEALAFFSVAFAYNLSQSRLMRSPALTWRTPKSLAVIYLGIGTAGLWFFFGDIDTLLSYLGDPASYLALQAAQKQGADWKVAASTFLRPFLGFAFVLMLCRLLDDPRPRFKLTKGAAGALTILAAAISCSMFSYNRGAFVAPMLAICAVLLAGRSRQARRLVLFTGLAGAVLLVVSTTYRATHGRTDLRSSLGDWQMAASELDFASQVQVYGNGPQFLGFVLEETEGGDLRWGGELVSALLSPVPVLGKDFRSSSGTALYNRLLNRGEAEDQVVSFVGELFLNFHVPGILVGFAGIGTLLSRLQDGFARSQSALPIYVTQLTATWLLFLAVGSLTVVAQIAIYFYWPVYVYLGWRRATQPQPPASTALK